MTSRQIKYGFERAFSTHVPSPYATVYFADIVGAPSKPGAIKDIPGIETPDDSTIVFKLKGPERGARLPGAGHADLDAGARGVREEVRRQDAVDLRPVRRLHRPVHGTRTTPRASSPGAPPGKSIESVRNPKLGSQVPMIARPTWNSITIEEGNDDAVSSARRILNGKEPRAGRRHSRRRRSSSRRSSRNKDQIAFIPGGGYRFMSTNSTIKPFDNLDVRKAVVAASDRKALQLTRGGTAAGDLATHFLPIDFPGFEEAGGAKGPLAGLHGPIRAATWRWPRSTCWRPRSRTPACRSTPAACGRTPRRC